MTVRKMTFKVGHTLTVVGVTKPDANFGINIAPNDEEIAIHINPRFEHLEDKNQVVCNSYQDGRWRKEVRQGGFPFRKGEVFKIHVEFTAEEFLVILSDGLTIHFPNPIGAEKYSIFSFEADAHIRSIDIK